MKRVPEKLAWLSIVLLPVFYLVGWQNQPEGILEAPSVEPSTEIAASTTDPPWTAPIMRRLAGIDGTEPEAGEVWAVVDLTPPYDIEGVADAIYRAYSMENDERQYRMQRLRRSVARQNVFWWVDSFLHTGTSKK